MFGIIVTNMVTCDFVVIHILQNGAEIGAGWVKFQAQLFGVTGGAFCFTDDPPQGAAVAFHELHTLEQINNNRPTKSNALMFKQIQKIVKR